MLSSFNGVKTAIDYADALAMVTNVVQNIVQDMETARIDNGRYKNQIASSLVWLSRASRNDVVLESELDSYVSTYEAHEDITFLVKDGLEEKL